MLLLIKVTLLCIGDQSVNCTFIIYENVQLLTLLKRDPRGRRLLRSTVAKRIGDAPIFAFSYQRYLVFGSKNHQIQSIFRVASTQF